MKKTIFVLFALITACTSGTDYPKLTGYNKNAQIFIFRYPPGLRGQALDQAETLCLDMGDHLLAEEDRPTPQWTLPWGMPTGIKMHLNKTFVGCVRDEDVKRVGLKKAGALAKARVRIFSAQQSYQDMPGVAAAAISISENIAIKNSPAKQTCVFQSEQASVLNKICNYSCLGSGYATTITRTQICPMTINR